MIKPVKTPAKYFIHRKKNKQIVLIDIFELNLKTISL